MTRRDFLRVGGVGLGSLGLGLADLDAVARIEAEPDRSVILLLLVGGPSQLETWDPKPDAPAEVRGPFRSIATRCPGVRILRASAANGRADGPAGARSVGSSRRGADP